MSAPPIRTFRMPTTFDGDATKEAFTPPNVPKKDWMRHYKTLWYGTQLPKHGVLERLWARLTRRSLPNRVLVVEVAVRDCPPKTADWILKQIADVKNDGIFGFGEVGTPQLYVDNFALRDRRHPNG